VPKVGRPNRERDLKTSLTATTRRGKVRGRPAATKRSKEMTKSRIEVITYDAATEVVATDYFDYIEDAIAFCQSKSPEKLEELDTEFGFQLMTPSEVERMTSPPKYEWPNRWYEVHGVEADGSIRYFEDEDYKEKA
jgi:hypothetical protein